MNTNTGTLFIADDEASIREGLKYIVDWQELGFQLCGEASDGENALRQILALQPSLVLLDVKMPRMHGTEVIRRAREAGFKGKCVILSGYSDFKYAQEAIKSGVSFYLTKPIDEDELYRTVTQIKEILDQEDQHTSHYTTFRDKARSIILYELMTNTLRTPLSAEDLNNYRLKADSYQVVICENFDGCTAPQAFAELLKVSNKDRLIFDYMNIADKIAVLLKGSLGLNRFTNFLERFEERVSQTENFPEALFLAYGRPVSSPSDIHLSYEDASALLSRRFFCAQEQHAMGYEMLPELSSAAGTSRQQTGLSRNENTLHSFARRFVDYIQSYNRKMIVSTLSELEETLMQSSDSATEIKLFLTDLYLQIKETISRNYAAGEMPFTANATVLEFIGSQKYLYEIIRFLSEQFEMIMNAAGNPSRDTIMDDVLYYIDHNFRNNIKLESMAPLFGYNSAYLGKIFNKTTGMSFNSYIDRKRIEYSKQLLLENRLKVYEIAEQAGYKNVDYFHKKFKKYVGGSPAEFRKIHGIYAETGNPPPSKKHSKSCKL